MLNAHEQRLMAFYLANAAAALHHRDREVRARIWARQLARRGIEALSEDALSLAREFEATPGVGAGATAAAGLAGGGIDAVRHGVRGLSRVLGCEKPPQGPPPKFEVGLIQADTDPVTLADCLVRDTGRGFSLCLQGPPGTGRRHIIKRSEDPAESRAQSLPGPRDEGSVCTVRGQPAFHLRRYR